MSQIAGQPSPSPELRAAKMRTIVVLGARGVGKSATVIQYVDDHFGIYVGGKEKAMEFIGKEVELDESLFLYFEIKDFGSTSKFELRNSILVESFDGQENKVNLNISKEGQSAFFNKSITSKEIEI